MRTAAGLLVGRARNPYTRGTVPRLEIGLIDRAEELTESSTESFDRIAFAERAVALIRPPRMTVAICAGSRSVQVASGRQWGKSEGSRWAVVSVPLNASRHAIASAVLALYDGAPSPYRDDPHSGHAARAWALDVLMTEHRRGAA
jgi:hypothetical protein